MIRTRHGWWRATSAAVMGSGPPSSADADVQAWITAIGAANTTQAEVNILTTMVQGIKSDLSIAAVLSEKFDRFWVYPTTKQAAAKVDLVARASHTEVTGGGTLTWTAQKGYTGDGVASYIDTGWIPSNGPNYTQNSGAMGLFIQTFESRGATVATQAAVITGSNELAIHKAGNTTQFIWRVNNTADITSAVTQGAGLWHVERTASNALALYKNGVSVGTSANASVARPTSSLFVMALSTGGTPSLWTNSTMAVKYAGVSLGATAVAQVSARVQTALNAINATNFP